jgi:hypothetical protein
MGYKKEKIIKLFTAVIICSFSAFIYGQSNKNSDKQVRFVFNQLISVYSSAKPAPILKVDKYLLPASYIANPEPIIKVDLALYKLCQTFGKDSLNALAVGAPAAPGLRIFSPLPSAIRSRLA